MSEHIFFAEIPKGKGIRSNGSLAIFVFVCRINKRSDKRMWLIGSRTSLWNIKSSNKKWVFRNLHNSDLSLSVGPYRAKCPSRKRLRECRIDSEIAVILFEGLFFLVYLCRFLNQALK